MIYLSCFNCGFVIIQSTFIKVDASTVDCQCVRCHAVYRVQINQLKAGVPHDDLPYYYTYDQQGNKIPWKPNKKETGK